MILDKHPNGASSLGRFIGYWGGQVRADFPDDNKCLPDPHDFVDETWGPTERARVVAYLKAGRRLIQWRGMSWCRFKCGERGMGSQCLTDGMYVWPSGFAHYVEKHGVKPPQEFIDHVMRRP